MHREIGSGRLELVAGNIVTQQVDAIVNAANAALAGGGGVDGAIHRQGGPKIMRETNEKYPSGCPTGSAVITSAGRLPAKFVIHAVGPVWQGGQQGEPDLLASAYRACWEVAKVHGCASLALPALSTGAYGYPLDLAAQVALHEAAQWLAAHPLPGVIRFVLFGEDAYNTFANLLPNAGKNHH